MEMTVCLNATGQLEVLTDGCETTDEGQVHCLGAKRKEKGKSQSGVRVLDSLMEQDDIIASKRSRSGRKHVPLNHQTHSAPLDELSSDFVEQNTVPTQLLSESSTGVKNIGAQPRQLKRSSHGIDDSSIHSLMTAKVSESRDSSSVVQPVLASKLTFRDAIMTHDLQQTGDSIKTTQSIGVPFTAMSEEMQPLVMNRPCLSNVTDDAMLVVKGQESLMCAGDAGAIENPRDASHDGSADMSLTVCQTKQIKLDSFTEPSIEQFSYARGDTFLATAEKNGQSESVITSRLRPGLKSALSHKDVRTMPAVMSDAGMGKSISCSGISENNTGEIQPNISVTQPVLMSGAFNMESTDKGQTLLTSGLLVPDNAKMMQPRVVLDVPCLNTSTRLSRPRLERDRSPNDTAIDLCAKESWQDLTNICPADMSMTVCNMEQIKLNKSGHTGKYIPKNPNSFIPGAQVSVKSDPGASRSSRPVDLDITSVQPLSDSDHTVSIGKNFMMPRISAFESNDTSDQTSQVDNLRCLPIAADRTMGDGVLGNISELSCRSSSTHSGGGDWKRFRDYKLLSSQNGSQFMESLIEENVVTEAGSRGNTNKSSTASGVSEMVVSLQNKSRRFVDSSSLDQAANIIPCVPQHLADPLTNLNKPKSSAITSSSRFIPVPSSLLVSSVPADPLCDLRVGPDRMRAGSLLSDISRMNYTIPDIDNTVTTLRPSNTAGYGCANVSSNITFGDCTAALCKSVMFEKFSEVKDRADMSEFRQMPLEDVSLPNLNELSCYLGNDMENNDDLDKNGLEINVPCTDEVRAILELEDSTVCLMDIESSCAGFEEVDEYEDLVKELTFGRDVGLMNSLLAGFDGNDTAAKISNVCIGEAETDLSLMIDSVEGINDSLIASVEDACDGKDPFNPTRVLNRSNVVIKNDPPKDESVADKSVESGNQSSITSPTFSICPSVYRSLDDVIADPFQAAKVLDRTQVMYTSCTVADKDVEEENHIHGSETLPFVPFVQTKTQVCSTSLVDEEINNSIPSTLVAGGATRESKVFNSRPFEHPSVNAKDMLGVSPSRMRMCSLGGPGIMDESMLSFVDGHDMTNTDHCGPCEGQDQIENQTRMGIAVEAEDNDRDEESPEVIEEQNISFKGDEEKIVENVYENRKDVQENVQGNCEAEHLKEACIASEIGTLSYKRSEVEESMECGSQVEKQGNAGNDSMAYSTDYLKADGIESSVYEESSINKQQFITSTSSQSERQHPTPATLKTKNQTDGLNNELDHKHVQLPRVVSGDGVARKLHKINDDNSAIGEVLRNCLELRNVLEVKNSQFLKFEKDAREIPTQDMKTLNCGEAFKLPSPKRQRINVNEGGTKRGAEDNMSSSFLPRFQEVGKSDSVDVERKKIVARCKFLTALEKLCS